MHVSAAFLGAQCGETATRNAELGRMRKRNPKGIRDYAA
jgi:hypothetical protein